MAGLLIGALVLITFGLFLFREGQPLSANAAYERVQPQANYTLSQYVDGEIGATRSGQAAIWSIPNNEAHRTQSASFHIVKRNVQGALYFTDGKYGKSLAYQEIGLQVKTVLTRQAMTLTDAKGQVIAMQTNDDELQVTLEEGKYHVNVTIFSNTWTRESDGKQEYYRLDAEYMFYVDMSDPYISGTYAEGEEQWVGVGHTVEALDDVSGDIKDFYFTKPDGTFVRYHAPQRSHTFQEGDLEGLYTFRAYDDAGWFSGARTVLFDGTAPVGKLSTADGTVLTNGDAVKQAFSFSATDAMSGIASLEYKTPTSADWETYSEGKLIEATAEEGEYLFRAIDRAGNCVECSVTLQSPDPCAAGHTYVAEKVDPTCTEEGFTRYTCSVCGDSYTGEKTPPLGHAYRDEIISPSCTEGGYTRHTCERCGDEYTDAATPALGHIFETYESAASCTEYGRVMQVCQRCGREEDGEVVSYPMGHDYSNHVIRSAECTCSGERVFHCDRCGYEYHETIPAIGHNYAITDTSSENGITTRVYTCTVCGDSYSQELGDQYEEVSSYVEELFETYSPYMWWVFLATAAIWSIVMGVFYAIAQKNEDKEKAKKMLVNYLIGLVVIFVIVVACPYLVRGIAALVT